MEASHKNIEAEKRKVESVLARERRAQQNRESSPPNIEDSKISISISTPLSGNGMCFTGNLAAHM